MMSKVDVIEDVKEVSPYDSNYPVQLLMDGIKKEFGKAYSAVEKIYRVVEKEAPIIAQIKKSTKTGIRYVVDMSDETINAIELGKIKLAVENGKMTAQIREANGNYGSKLGIKREVFRDGLDVSQMANALQMKALENQIEQMTCQIVTINQNVHSVLEGQQNDRIGLYYSGLSLYLESKNVMNEQLKNQLAVQALSSLSESSFQLELNMKSDIKYLVEKGYESEKRQRLKLIDEKISSINKCFEFIHQASMLRAAIYCERGEMLAMLAVLSEYSQLVESTIVNNASLLSECDPNDNGTPEGIWGKRADLRLDVNDIKAQIALSNKTLYLGLAKEG